MPAGAGNRHLMNATSRPPTLDPPAVARWQASAPLVAPWLHEEVASRMLERLQWIKLRPSVWAHWGAVRGGPQAHAKLLAAYPDAASFIVEAHERRAQAAHQLIATSWWNPARWVGPRSQIASPGPATLDMLWANMALHETAEPLALMAKWQAALKVGGFVMFSCLGPDTARELRSLYASLGWPPAGHELTDMHDWGDMLVQTGFAEPVMDMERIVLTFETPERLLSELAGLGRNFHPARFAGLRGGGWKKQLLQRLEALRSAAHGNQLALTFEIIYGHALKAAPKIKVASVSALSEGDMRSLLKASRPLR
jgi:malonyl-CoA O-methyltransferase